MVLSMVGEKGNICLQSATLFQITSESELPLPNEYLHSSVTLSPSTARNGFLGSSANTGAPDNRNSNNFPASADFYSIGKFQ